MTVEAFLLAMPKVELHVHLEGSLEPATLLRLARRNRVELPADSEEGLRRWFSFTDFEHFVQVYLTCSRCLRTPEDFQLLVEEFLRAQARQNVPWSEAHFTISTHLANGGNGGEILNAMAEAMVEGERRWGVRMRLIPDIVRNVGFKAADRTVEWALDGRDHGVIALGLSGSEKDYPSAPFRPHFDAAAAAGLHCVAHAGEHAGPESVREVLDHCRSERIGHGVRSIEDPALVAALRDGGVPLEVCPTSNVRLGVVPDLAAHPFDRLRRAGVRVTVNSDDPPLFNTTLSEEYGALGTTFDYAPEQLAQLAIDGLAASFLPAGEKEALDADFRRQFADQGERWLGRRIEPAA